MRKPSSMYALVKSFQSSLSAGLMARPSCVASATYATEPSSARMRSSSSRKNVVLPAPLLPTSPSISPEEMLRLVISTAVLSPNVFLRLSTVMFIVRSACYLRLRPWQCLNFLPLPHGHGSLGLGILSFTIGVRLGCCAPSRVSWLAATRCPGSVRSSFCSL